MYQLILASLSRQEKGLELLQTLLEQEYRLICQRKMDLVSHLEFSIQELIRQLVVEKEFVMERLCGTPLRTYAEGLSLPERTPLLETLLLLDDIEQKTSRQASRNSQLALALLDQNARSMQTLFDQALPQRTLVYGRKGAMQQVAEQGALISGRL
ncbi:MAG: flagellar export chaperone FlgN [Desulfovibrio sp.]|nr:flagellar export chaperone FlgN [Desulfovibrio sp.]